MNIPANNLEEYISKVLEERIPKGFEDQMSCGMIGYVIPKSTYLEGCHCDTKLSLPFVKN